MVPLVKNIPKSVVQKLIPTATIESKDYSVTYRKIKTFGRKKFRLEEIKGIKQTTSGKIYLQMEVQTSTNRYTRISLFAPYEQLLFMKEGQVVYAEAFLIQKKVNKQHIVSPSEYLKGRAYKHIRKKYKTNIYHNIDLVLISDDAPLGTLWLKVSPRTHDAEYPDVIFYKKNPKNQGGIIYTSKK